MSNKQITSNTVIREVLQLLSRQLPSGWESTPKTASAKRGLRPDALIEMAGPDGKKCVLIVGFKKQLPPKDVPAVTQQLTQYAQQLGKNASPLVLSPFLSEGTRERLEAAQIGYADRTGNVRIVSSQPAIYIKTQGAEKDPNRENRPTQSLKGRKAGCIVRALCDWLPPFGIRSLAEKTGVNAGNVSRIITFLENEALLERKKRGPITVVRWRELIRRWAKDYSFYKLNRVYPYLEPRDVAEVPKKLAATDIPYAVTGSAAAATAAPVAPTRLIIAYAEDPSGAACDLDLRQAETGANVLLAEPYDTVVFERTTVREGICYAALSQVAVDLLSAPGRGPSEAEALLDWMEENEGSWRS